jgi:glycosyltransferase involved in cell wall biosynthesis
MEAHYPRISIVTPSYNQGQYLEETIQSILSQNYPNLEYIIIDGGSTDSSVDIIKRYSKYLAFWVSEKDKGQSDAINKGFAKATGDIFTWLNSDDLYNPGVLFQVADYWTKHPDCRFLTGDGEYVDPTGRIRWYYYKAGPFSHTDLFHTCKGIRLLQPSVFFGRDAFVQAGGLENDLYYAMDLDLWLRILRKHKLHYLPICISRLRRHEKAKTWPTAVESVEKEIGKVIERYLDEIDMFNRIIVKYGLSRRKARALFKRGLAQYFTNDRMAAVGSFKEALAANPGAIFSREGMKLFARIVIPKSLKRLIFKRPRPL